MCSLLQTENGLNLYCGSRGDIVAAPTIIEAAMALYNDHTVDNISRNDAGAINLSQTAAAIAEIIRISREQSKRRFAL